MFCTVNMVNCAAFSVRFAALEFRQVFDSAQVSLGHCKDTLLMVLALSLSCFWILDVGHFGRYLVGLF